MQSRRWMKRVVSIRESFFFSVIHNGFASVIPVFLAGAIACALVNLPLPVWQEWMNGELAFFAKLCNAVHNATYGTVSVCLTISLSAYYAMEKNQKIEDILLYVMVALVAFGTQLNIGTDYFSTDMLGVKGCFSAVFITMSACWMYSHLSKIKALSLSKYTSGMNLICAKALSILGPMVIIALIFSLCSEMLYHVFAIVNIQGVVYKVIFWIFDHISSEFLRGLVYTLLLHILWLSGCHGSQIMELVVEPYFATVGEGVIFSKSFLDTYVVMGGCGTTICVLLAILFFVKRKRLRNIAKLAAFPSIFNVNEALTFGIPIVLNPVMAIPFLLTPALCYCLAYLACQLHWVPELTNEVFWTTPVLVSGYIGTGSMAGGLLQLALIALGVAIYTPFLRWNEQIQEEAAKRQINRLVKSMQKKEAEGEAPDFLQETNQDGIVARMLLTDLKQAVERNEVFLLYQPQMDYDGHCCGAEALLRWEHREYGFIYPPLIIYLAKAGGILPELETKIFDMAASAMQQIERQYNGAYKISINITASSLRWDIESGIRQALQKYNVMPKNMWIEITEQDVISNVEVAEGKLRRLKRAGHKLLVDDFGMGHTSLTYLQSNLFDMVKLDGSLVRNLAASPTSQKIIASVVELSNQLGLYVIAEYVENEEQKELLHDLGCGWYQGYLYSKPIELDKFIVFIREYNQNIKEKIDSTEK